MGYTHYWSHNGFTPEQWAQLQRAARTIAKRSKAQGAPLGDWQGAGRGPSIDASAISLNGRKGEGFETFMLASTPEEFGFCKTGRRPYDAAVVAILTVAARINSGFTWRSDGDESEHSEGRAMAADLPRKGATGGAATVEG